MVARYSKSIRRSNIIHVNSDNDNDNGNERNDNNESRNRNRTIMEYKGSSSSSSSTSAIHNSSPERKKNLIEAIVFSADVLSTAPPIMCVLDVDAIDGAGTSTSTSTSSTSSSSSSSLNGVFGIQRGRLISYENAEELTRKVDALFHRKRSLLSSGAAREIRDPIEDDEEDDLLRMVDDTTSTCPSTNPSVSQRSVRGDGGDDYYYCSSSYSSSYYSQYYCNNVEDYYLPPSDSNNRPLCGDEENGSLPDFLKGVKFKRTTCSSDNRRNCKRKQLEVIALPPSSPSMSSSYPLFESNHPTDDDPNVYHSNNNSNNNNNEMIEVAVGVTDRIGSKKDPINRRRRRLRRTKAWWKKTVLYFRC